MSKVSQVEKVKILRSLINSDQLEFIMEAHSGISAVIAEEAGFKGIWASGLTLSAMTGCRDRNELDISEVCKVIEWIADHTNVPILVDGDTGGVDPNAARIMVNKLTKAGAAGVCIEDKLYPKHNSFLSNSGNDLADPKFHANKIIEMKKENSSFVVVARLESFIAGRDVNDAIYRANIYQEAGADAILVHSKRKDCEDIRQFMSRWNSDKYKGEGRVPIIIVPTKYYTTPSEVFRDLRISLVIWANHQMRASIQAMQSVCKKVFESQSLVSIEDNIATVSEIFRLQRDDELVKKEKEYLPANKGSAIVLSATSNKSSKLKLPKCFETVSGISLLDYTYQSFSNCGVDKVTLVLGQNYEVSHDYEFTIPTEVVINDIWSSTSEVGSLKLALDHDYNSYKLPLFITYGDLLFSNTVYEKFDKRKLSDYDIIIGVDPEYDYNNYNEFVSGNSPISIKNLSGTSDVVHVSDSYPDNDFIGIFTGILKVKSALGLNVLRSSVNKVYDTDPKLRFHKVLQECLDSCKIGCVYINSSEWVDINKSKDFSKGESIIND